MLRNDPSHRNLFNADCNFLFVGDIPAEPDGPFSVNVLHRFVDLVAESGVDTYVCNANAQKPWYPSRVLPSILEGYKRGDREFARRQFRPASKTDSTPDRLEKQMATTAAMLDRYLDLVEAKADWLAHISTACRRNHISPWLSIRMNDGHGANSWEGSYMNCALQKEPRYRLSGREINPRRPANHYQQLLNYEHAEVRDYYFTMAREMVEDYDFEGLELDWLRTPLCCEAPASQKTIDTMTEWIGEIRALTQRQAARTGQPYPLGLRLPVRLGLLREIGLDVKAMARQGLIDFVSFSNFWQTSWDVPYDELRRELGETVAIYGVVEAAPNALLGFEPVTGLRNKRLTPASAELLRGNAAGKLATGCDGIETFNFFCADSNLHTGGGQPAIYSALRGLGDLATLRGLPKHYALAARPGLYEFPIYEYAEQLPATVEAQGWRAFRLAMCAEPPGKLHDLTVQLVLSAPTAGAAPELGVSFNSSQPNFAAQATNTMLFRNGALTDHIPEHRAYNFRFDPAMIREGWNEILVTNDSRPDTSSSSAPPAVRIVSVEVALR